MQRFSKGVIRDTEDCEPVRINLKEANLRRWSLHTLAKDAMIQQEWGSFISEKDGQELMYIHCNRNATAWAVDRHDRKIGEQIQTGKGPSQKSGQGGTQQAELKDEVDDLCSAEGAVSTTDTAPPSPATQSNSTTATGTQDTKICPSGRGGNIHKADDDDEEAEDNKRKAGYVCNIQSKTLTKLSEQIMKAVETKTAELEVNSEKEEEETMRCPLSIEGAMVQEGPNQWWETEIRCPKGEYAYQIVVIRLNGVTTHVYTEQFTPREYVTDKIKGGLEVHTAGGTLWPVVDHFTWLWTEKKDYSGGWDEPENPDNRTICWRQCKGTQEILVPNSKTVIGRWHRTTPGRDGQRRIEEKRRSNVSKEERRQEWPVTKWIEKVLMEHSEKGGNVLGVTYTSDLRKIVSPEEFTNSIKRWLIVPQETMGLKLQVFADSVYENDVWTSQWPECLVWPISKSKETDTRTTKVNLRWGVVTQCMKAGHRIEGIRKQKRRAKKSKGGTVPEGGVMS